MEQDRDISSDKIYKNVTGTKVGKKDNKKSSVRRFMQTSNTGYMVPLA
ncbi:hypothetical protein [Psychrobacter vallis]|nr:hypothetical protein [Psychrobacter vallis]